MHFEHGIYFGKGKIKKLSRKAFRLAGKFFYGFFRSGGIYGAMIAAIFSQVAEQ